jgi:hypothetical protein
VHVIMTKLKVASTFSLQLAHAGLSEQGPDPRAETVSATARRCCGGVLAASDDYIRIMIYMMPLRVVHGNK